YEIGRGMNLIKKMFFSMLIGASVLVTAACGNAEDNANEEKTTQEQPAENNEETAAPTEMPEPDLEGVPDLVAEVNGEEIKKEEFESAYVGQFQQMAMQAQMSGQEVDQDQLKTQIAESLVGQRLLMQETDNRSIEASDEEIDNTLTSIAEQNGLA